MAMSYLSYTETIKRGEANLCSEAKTEPSKLGYRLAANLLKCQA